MLTKYQMIETIICATKYVQSEIKNRNISKSFSSKSINEIKYPYDLAKQILKVRKNKNTNVHEQAIDIDNQLTLVAYLNVLK